MATPHIESKKEDIAKLVLMPGDPNRAKFIADNYLKDCKVVNTVRGMRAYTGYYEGKKITIFPSGMGIPSIGIYAYELFSEYDVDIIIRIGTMGAYHEKLKIGDLVLAKRAYTDSSFGNITIGSRSDYLDSCALVNEKIMEVAKESHIMIHYDDIYTTDAFYSCVDYKQIMEKYPVVGTEMESFGLFCCAKRCHKKAAAIFTVSDSFVYEEELTSQERERNLKNMIEIALKSSLNL